MSLVEARLVVASEQQVAGWQVQRLSRPGSSPTTSLCVSTTSETAFPPSTPGVAQAPLSDITQMSDGDTGWHKGSSQTFDEADPWKNEISKI